MTGDVERGGTLAWQCTPDALNVMLLFPKRLGGDSAGEIVVCYRFDRDPASDFEIWRLFPDGDTAWLRMGQVEAFTRNARGSRHVLVQVLDPEDSEELRFVFGLEGLSEALTRLPCAGA